MLGVEALSEWPLVLPDDDGIRPGGDPDRCLYCQQQVGSPHGADCVIVTKLVKVRYVYEIAIRVPHDSTPEDIEFHRGGGSSWCAGNAQRDIETYVVSQQGPEGCACPYFSCEYVGVADDTPKRMTRAEAEAEAGLRFS